VNSRVPTMTLKSSTGTRPEGIPVGQTTAPASASEGKRCIMAWSPLYFGGRNASLEHGSLSHQRLGAFKRPRGLSTIPFCQGDQAFHYLGVNPVSPLPAPRVPSDEFILCFQSERSTFHGSHLCALDRFTRSGKGRCFRRPGEDGQVAGAGSIVAVMIMAAGIGKM